MTMKDLHDVREADILRPNATDHQDDFRLLRRLSLPSRLHEVENPVLRRGLVVDVEATGLSLAEDEVVQLAILPFSYDANTGLVLEVHHSEAYEGMREPSIPMSEEASLVTGITDADLRGQQIDSVRVEHIVAEADLVVAHNAAFDRPMTEKYWRCFEDKAWACSLADVDWLREGFAAGKLDYLGMQFGWFFEGHRALTDCEACLALLTRELPRSGQLVLNALRVAAQKPRSLVRAVNAPFDKKDDLKKRHYKWRPADARFDKFWWTITEDLESESEWLISEVYGRERRINASTITPMTRFSERMWELD